MPAPLPAPRLFLVRHGESTRCSLRAPDDADDADDAPGETEWSLNGRTGRSDIPLTPRGQQQIKDKAPILVGQGRPLDPASLGVVFVSPRIRAQTTFHLLFEHLPELPRHVVTEQVREWDYGDYEGLFKTEILAKQPGWDIWKDGCPGGESVDDMRARVDGMIAKVREHHRLYLEEGKGARDVLIVAHGHFNRAFISRWICVDLALGTHFKVEPGGVSVLSYNHGSLDEPALDALNVYADV